MTHKICISLDEESWRIIQDIITVFKADEKTTRWVKAQANPSAVIRAALDALKNDAFVIGRLDDIIRRKWTSCRQW